MKSFILVCLSIVFIVFSCSQKRNEKVDLVLLNTIIVDVQNNKTIKNQFIVIKENAIFSTGSMEDIQHLRSLEKVFVKGVNIEL
ncbi:MAG: hypothetical protein ACQETL_12105 [Bacteroidota bacterium]